MGSALGGQAAPQFLRDAGFVSAELTLPVYEAEICNFWTHYWQTFSEVLCYTGRYSAHIVSFFQQKVKEKGER